MELFDLDMESTQAIDESFDDEVLGGDSVGFIVASSNIIEVPIEDWLYNQTNTVKFYDLKNVLYNLETND